MGSWYNIREQEGTRGQGSWENIREQEGTRGYHARRWMRRTCLLHRMLPTSTDHESCKHLTDFSPVEHLIGRCSESYVRKYVTYVCLPTSLSYDPSWQFHLQSLWGYQLKYEIWYSCWASLARGSVESHPGHHPCIHIIHITNPTWS